MGEKYHIKGAVDNKGFERLLFTDGAKE